MHHRGIEFSSLDNGFLSCEQAESLQEICGQLSPEHINEFFQKKTNIKQYFKENRALRTEPTIKDARDFSVGKRLRNLDHLRNIAVNVNRRLLEVQRISQDCIICADSVERLTQPSETEDGQRASAFKVGDPRVQHYLLHSLCFRILRTDFETANCGFTLQT